MRTSVAALAGLLLAFAANADGPPTASPEDRFAEAVTLMESHRFDEALPILEALASTHPSETVFWNLGLAAAETGAHDSALKAWLAYREAVPDDWRCRTKLIQSYQALGNIEARDRERAALIELWRSGTDKTLSREKLFVREQFRVNGETIAAFEYFDPRGDYRIVYSFLPVGRDDANWVKVSLGSYETTNLIAWELGEIPRDHRLYHLDLYAKGLHETHGFYDNLPSYETVRAAAIAVFEKRSEPLSATTSGR